MWALATAGPARRRCSPTPCRSGCCSWPGSSWARGCEDSSGSRSALAFVGLLLILAPGSCSGCQPASSPWAAAFAGRPARSSPRSSSKRHEVDLLSLTAWQMLLGSVPLIIIAALTAHRAPVWSASFIWALAFNVVLANALAWVSVALRPALLPAGSAGIGTLAIPVVGVARGLDTAR